MIDAPPVLLSSHDLVGQAAAPEAARAPELAIALLSASPDCVKVLDETGRLVFMSQNGLCAMDIDDPAQVTGQFWWSLWPEAEASKLRAAVARANDGEATRFDAFCPTMKGVPKWWDVTVAPIIAVDGSVSQVLAVSRDVTELKDRNARLEAALAESMMLRREVDHRVKNSLGLVSSLLSLQARAVGAGDAADALRQASVRVRTIASVHDRLHHSADHADMRLDEYLVLLGRDIAVAVGAAATIEMAADMAPLRVHPDGLAPIGLIMSELIGNAAKHGMRDGASCRITVTLTQTDASEGMLVVADDGPGLAQAFDPDTGRGMGLRVVMSMVQKIAGRMTWGRSDTGGALFLVSFPLNGVAPVN